MRCAQALAETYPSLERMQLIDYKVRILAPEQGTAAVTRVIIESGDGEGRVWQTVGVSANIIDASYAALHDAITFQLFIDGATSARRMSAPGPPAPAVILCRTQMGENIGTAARAMLNFGLTELRLVAPQCGWPNAKAVVAASGAVAGAQRASGCSPTSRPPPPICTIRSPRPPGRARWPSPSSTPRLRRPRPRRCSARAGGVGIVFGPERTGLTNDELLLADALVSYPVNPAFASLNLAQAVLLFGYAWFRRGAGARRPRSDQPERRPATKAEIQGLVDHLVRELDQVDFFRAEERRASLIRAIAVMLERRQWTTPGGPSDARHDQGSGRRPKARQKAATKVEEGCGDAMQALRLWLALVLLARPRGLRAKPPVEPDARGGGPGVRGADGAGPARQGSGFPVADTRAGGDQPDRAPHRLCRPPAAGDGGRRARHRAAGRRQHRHLLSLPDRPFGRGACSSTSRPRSGATILAECDKPPPAPRGSPA